VIPLDQNSSSIANMEMVLNVYKRPFDPQNPVICMDESPKQLIAETRILIPCSPRKPARYNYEYKRNGMCNIFLVYELLTGKRMVKLLKEKPSETGFIFWKKLHFNMKMQIKLRW
jgi:hypothetical protein